MKKILFFVLIQSFAFSVSAGERPQVPPRLTNANEEPRIVRELKKRLAVCEEVEAIESYKSEDKVSALEYTNLLLLLSKRAERESDQKFKMLLTERLRSYVDRM